MALGKNLKQDEVDEFLSERRHAIFATNHKGGPPQLSPVWYIWEDGALHVSTSARSLKARHVETDNLVTACIDGGWGDYRYVAMSGEVTVVPSGSDSQREMRWRIIRKYHDSDESAQAYFDASAEEESVILVLRPSRIIYRDFNS